MAPEQVIPLESRRWETEGLRLTNFMQPQEAFEDVDSWWAKLVGHDPDEVRSRPAQKQWQQIGKVDGTTLALVVQPGRVDLQFVPNIPSQEEFDQGLPTIGSFDDVKGQFLDLGKQWLSESPPTTRLAYGAVLLRPMPDLSTANAEISEYIPEYVIPEGSSDFLFQINLTRKSQLGVDSLTINRLSKWSVARVGRVDIVLSGDARPHVTKDYPMQIACRLELDISTSADFTDEIPKDNIHAIFEELIKFGSEIAAKGAIS